MGSVRVRTALGATVVVALALAAAGLVIVQVLSAGLQDNAQVAAEGKAREVAAQVAAGGPPGLAQGLETDAPVQVVDGSGRVLAASDGVAGALVFPQFHRAGAPSSQPTEGDDADGPDEDEDGDEEGGGDGGEVDGGADPGEWAGEWEVGASVGGAPAEVEEDAGFRDVSLRVDEDGRATADPDEATGTADFRVAALRTVSAGVPVTVYAGSSLTSQRAAVSDVTWSMLGWLPVLLVVVAAVTWLVTGRSLRPVEAIRAEMAEIRASDLSRRVPEPRSRDEVARLARTTNETLAALEDAVERQRRFVADASHELRSPIASLRTQLEVATAHPRLLVVDDVLADVVRLQGLASDLLLLARLDAGERPGGTRVDLAAMVREELAQRHRTDRVPVVEYPEEPPGGWAATGGVEVVGSRGQLARVLANLLDNAQRHAASEVGVTLRRDGRWVALQVADDGPGVPEDQRERVFERFVRLDDARSRDDGGAGLGLAIARDVAVRHGGSLSVRRAPSGGALFELLLPAV
ncbi:histidine kinase [Wenjunlia vitaminophila]|uniref:histidine kinase n=1 Tax=Wenjunlia vitaminophila TaxID=76728 RepID=A0A0T6LU40_WENVI|nr:HAMP domain-containing sensor histidine kinase [Wenjunlia vitaminophila]KRV49508.1 histidine kinase [Wenjunlia vitaminophila]